MRILKLPLRCSLFGGGADLPYYVTRFGCTIVSFAIGVHLYVIHNKRPTGGCRLSYSKTEELSSLTSAKHTLVNEAANRYGYTEPCTLSIISDVPKGTGLGSSSALAVALVKLMDKCKRAQDDLAREAFGLEYAVATVGIQDSLPAIFGGFRVYHIGRDWSIQSEEVPTMARLVDDFGLLLYTGIERDATPILKKGWQQSVDKLHLIQDLADSVVAEINTLDVARMGDLLNYTWTIKSKIGGVSNPGLDAQHEIIGKHAYGSKLLGAGGGGCWFVLCHPNRRQMLIDEIELRPIPFAVSKKGLDDDYF